MRAVHYLQISLAVLAGAAMNLAVQEPLIAGYAHIVSSAATSLLMALGLASGAVGQAPPPKPSDVPQAPAGPQPVVIVHDPSNPVPVRMA